MAFLPSRLFQRQASRRAAVLSLFGLAAVFLGGQSDAHPPSYADGPYSVTLEDEQGNALRTFRHDGATFALGYVGERYEVRIENHSDRRVEAVLTVDGRDAVSGNVGDFVHERGYLVAPHGSVRIDGFRRTLSETAAFRFASPASSYSARMGTPENVGVIGVAFFPERRLTPPPRPPVRPFRYYPWPSDKSARRESVRPRTEDGESLGGGGAGRAEKRSSAPAPAPSAASGQPSASRSAADAHARAPGTSRGYDDAWKDDARDRDAESAPSRLGTEYGESTWSPVTEVPFERQNSAYPAAMLTLRYDDADGLIARGIDVYPHRYWADWSDPAPSWPDPFPKNRFAPPPP
jgi:hypothetical protein